MKRNNVLIIFVCFISVLFIIQPILALSANSSNYSVGRFGTGLATSNASSTNYESLFLSESQGTTRNAESYIYTANIGFFDNTPYYRTVSITSYSVYPESAVQGSIIRLSASALNFESVWAVLTLPNTTQETITLTNNGNTYYTANAVGTYTVIFYANSSQGNLASVIETFDITSPVVPSTTPPAGGGTTTVVEKCTYIWDCTSWNICLNGTQERECKNTGNCTGIEGKPIEARVCSDALFDVVIRLNEVEITQNKTLKFDIDLKETKGVEKIDVQIKYSIINNNNTEIFSQIETRAIQGNLTYNKEITEIKLKDGEYILRVDIIYGNQQRAFAEQKFEVIKGEIAEGKSIKEYFISLFEKVNYKIILLFVIFIGGLILILWLILLIIKKLGKRERRKTKKKFQRKHKENTIKGLLNKKVYSSDGVFIGKLKEVILEKKKIHSLKINLNKKRKFRKKGIIVDYKYVSDIKDVVIIDERVLSSLK